MKTYLSILVGLMFSVSLAVSGTFAAPVPDANQTVAGGGVTAKVS